MYNNTMDDDIQSAVMNHCYVIVSESGENL